MHETLSFTCKTHLPQSVIFFSSSVPFFWCIAGDMGTVKCDLHHPCEHKATSCPSNSHGPTRRQGRQGHRTVTTAANVPLTPDGLLVQNGLHSLLVALYVTHVRRGLSSPPHSAKSPPGGCTFLLNKPDRPTTPRVTWPLLSSARVCQPAAHGHDRRARDISAPTPCGGCSLHDTGLACPTGCRLSSAKPSASFVLHRTHARTHPHRYVDRKLWL